MRKRKRETGMGEKDRKRDNSGRERERKIVRETGVGEKDAGDKERGKYRGRKRERERGERGSEREGGEKKTLLLQTQKNSWNFILSCFNPVTDLIPYKQPY